MRSLRDYVTETEHWADRPRVGDDLDIELAPDELIEGRVIESDGEYIVLEISQSAVGALQQRGLVTERIGRYGAVGSSRGMGYSLGEGVMSEIDLDLRHIADSGDPGELIDALQGEMGLKTAEYLQHMMQEIQQDLQRRGMGDRSDMNRDLDILMDRIRSQYADDQDMQEQVTIGEDYMGRMLELAGMAQPMAETAPMQPNPNAARTDPLAAKAADLAPVGTMKDPGTAATVDEGAMKDIATELAEIADDEDYDALYDLLTATSPAGELAQDMYADVSRDFGLHPDDDQDMILDRLMDRIVDDYGDRLQEVAPPENVRAQVAQNLGRQIGINTPVGDEDDRPLWQRAYDKIQSRVKSASRTELDRDIEANRDAIRDARKAQSLDESLAEGFDQRRADAYNRAISSGQSPEAAEKIAGIRDEDMHFYEIDTDGQMKRLRVRAATAEPMKEAEYQGRKVSLGKPMRGDVKKFKVYVKDPKTGNVKKVNFGHGGKSAKRAGEKTLSIKKSNPARRRSFRARHNCDNPGPRTKARYWSCRAW